MAFRLARRVFSLFFIVAVFGGALANVYVMYPTLKRDFTGFGIPESVDGIYANIQWVEEVARSDIAGKFQFVETYGYIQNLLGMREYDDFTNVLADNGALNLTRFYPPPLNYLRKYASRLSRMKRAIQDRGGELLFISPPSLVNNGVPTYAHGLPYADENPIQDVFLHHLREYGIDYLDARSYLRERGFTPEQIVYKTDHHWTNQASFEVFKGMVGKIESAFGIALDPDGFYRDDVNYNFRLYPKSFLGFLGRSTGAAYVGYEDFTVIWPKFAGNYTSEIIDGAGLNIRTGPTLDTIYNTLRLTDRKMYTSTMYDVYLFGIQPYTRVVNLDKPDGLKILMITDSFGPPLGVYLAPMVGEIRMVWPRAEFSKIDIDKFFADQKFDYVILELYAENISDNGIYFFADPDDDKAEDLVTGNR